MLTSTRNPHTRATAGLAARGVIQGVVGRGLNFALAYFATIILARSLGPAAYGAYGVVVSVLIWIEQTARFTIPPAAAKLIPEDEERSKSIERTALSLGFLLFLLLFALLWAGADQLAGVFGFAGDGARWFRIAALDLPLFGLYVVYRGVLQGRHDFLGLGVADVVYSAVKLAAVVLLVGVWLSVSGALVANMLASLGALAYVMSRLSIRMGRPSAAAWAPLIRLALPLGLYMLAFQTIANLDLWSLTALDHARDADTIGLYVAARNVAVVPGVILMVVSDVLLPLLSGAVAAGNAPLSRGYVQGAVRFLSILVVPIAVVLALAADDIMTVLYSGRFRPAGAYARVLVLYAVSLPFMDLFASALSARGEPYRGGVTLLLVVPLAAISNVVFIGWYGAVGAAYASALAGVTATVVLGVLVVRRFGPLFTWRTLSNTAVAATMTALLARQFAAAESHLVLAAFGCVAVYGLMLIVLREIRAADLEPFAFWRSCRT